MKPNENLYFSEGVNKLIIMIPFLSEIGLVVHSSLLATRCQTWHVFYFE